MAKKQNTPKEKGQSKDKKKDDDRTTFYQFLSDKSTSCTDVAETTGIRQKSCTQYKRFWEKLGKLQVIKYEKCPHTKRIVQHITTNQNLFTKPTGIQTNLFEQ